MKDKKRIKQKKVEEIQTRRNKTEQYGTEGNETRQNEIERNRTEQNETKRNGTERSGTGMNRTRSEQAVLWHGSEVVKSVAGQEEQQGQKWIGRGGIGRKGCKQFVSDGNGIARGGICNVFPLLRYC